jgi:trimeric autotransporter adhesin
MVRVHRSALSLSSIALLLASLPAFAVTVYDTAVLASNPTAYWTLADTSGTTAVNLTGNAAYNGTYVGGYTQNATGPFAGALATTFNGSTGHVQLPGIWGGTAEATVIAWFNQSGGGGFQAIVESTDTSFAHLQTNTGGGNVWYYTGGASSNLPIITPLYSNWRMAVITTANGIQREYLDGVVIGSNTITYSTIQPTPNNGLFIGRGFGGGRYFNGSIANVAIYDRALTPTEVTSLFNSSSSVPEPASALLALAGLSLAFWRKHRRSR